MSHDFFHVYLGAWRIIANLNSIDSRFSSRQHKIFIWGMNRYPGNCMANALSQKQAVEKRLSSEQKGNLVRYYEARITAHRFKCCE